MNKSIKRASLILALTPVLSAPVVAYAATGPVVSTASTTTVTTHQDAPPASASAVAADVAGVITIGSTSTTAGSSGGAAHAHALDVLGTTVSGGDTTNGKQGGNLVATPDNPVGDAELAPWNASVTSGSTGTQSQAEAALAHAGLLGVLQLWLLHSQSQSTWTPDASHGHSSSDGAEANLDNQLDVKVLHAETDSNGKGSSALLVINGTGIGTSDQMGASCALNVDPLADLLCLQASGGTGANGTTTQSAYVSKVTGVLPGVTTVGATSGGGRARAVSPAVTKHRAENGPLPHTNGPASGRLPFTGAEIGLLVAYGAGLTGLGAAITRVARRRRKGAVPA